MHYNTQDFVHSQKDLHKYSDSNFKNVVGKDVRELTFLIKGVSKHLLPKSYPRK